MANHYQELAAQCILRTKETEAPGVSNFEQRPADARNKIDTSTCLSLRKRNLLGKCFLVETLQQ
jgi:hypothetical protein